MQERKAGTKAYFSMLGAHFTFMDNISHSRLFSFGGLIRDYNTATRLCGNSKWKGILYGFRILGRRGFHCGGEIIS
jgi:hypothetical protein